MTRRWNSRALDRRFGLNGAHAPTMIWDVHDAAIPEWYRPFLARMGIAYISVRRGSEVNYLVFLDQQMQKFAEREIYWEEA